MALDKNPEVIITVGASAGGLNAMSELVAQLPEDINAAVFVVLHLSKVGMGNFVIHRLQKYTTYTCKIAVNEERIKPNHIYVAPPDAHLLMKDHHVVIGQGPSENRWRPSIDVLFRSAAVNYGNHVVGIVLTGYLNDGTSGMLAIKESGGTCIVQDPNEAEYPDMPLSVLETMEVDYCISLARINETIKEVTHKIQPKQVNARPHVIRETEIAEKSIVNLEAIAEIGEKSLYVCPDCGGGLWTLPEDKNTRYRCHVGHSYGEKDLLLRQAESLEATLWVALRMMEERRVLLTRVSERDANKGLSKLGLLHQQRAADLERHIEKLKELLFDVKKD
jgi:two-component system chemotaxis response regulator CheB